MVLTAFGSVIFPLQPTEVTGHSGILALVAKVSPFDSQNSNSRINALQIYSSFTSKCR